MEQTAYIGLGSNLGDCTGNLLKALALLNKHERVSAVRPSSFYETKPLGSIEQPVFINAVAEVKTTLTLRQLFECLQVIEHRMGRERQEHWGPRVIDLDLVLYGDAVVNEPDLQVPHPQMHLRSFVLNGLCQLAPNVVHPLLKQPVTELAARLNGQDFFFDSNRPQLVCIAGNIGVGKTTLAQNLSKCLGATFIAENYSDNPYLADVYAGKRESALDSELFFLSSGASQLYKHHLCAGKVYAADYVFDKAMIYASAWLDGEQMYEYKRYYRGVADTVTTPVLVIYLNDSLEHCLERIHNRNRPYEQRIERAFLEKLQNGYEKLYSDFKECPVIRMTSDRCYSPEQVDSLARQASFYIAKCINENCA